MPVRRILGKRWAVLGSQAGWTLLTSRLSTQTDWYIVHLSVGL